MGSALRKNRRTARKDHQTLTYDYDAVVSGLAERRKAEGNVPPDKDEVARVLADMRGACLATEYSFTHLARDLGVGYQAIMDWFAGRTRPNAENWQKILDWMQELSAGMSKGKCS